MKRILRILLLGLLLFGARAALANPARCSPGYQDSTCPSPISHAAVPAPQCSTGAGWTTIANAVWMGAQWSQPQCNYQPAPVCPAGYTQTSAPSWNGSSWSAPGCSPPVAAATPTPPPAGPTCLYAYNYSIVVGDAGNCSADGGCDGTGLFVQWGGNGFQYVWTDYWPGLHTDYDMAQIEPLVQASLARSGGYSRGALFTAGGGNGNVAPSYYWYVCH